MTETNLECEHKLFWTRHPPRLGERIWCQDCKDMRQVVSISGSWIAKCSVCRWHLFRLSVEGLQKPVIRHISEKGHAVQITNHDESQIFTVRTPHAARDGIHSASDDAMTPSSRPPTLPFGE